MKIMTPVFIKGIYWVSFVLCLLQQVNAQFLTEPFSYGIISDSLTGVSSNWTAHSTSTGNKVQYLTTGLSSPSAYPAQSGGSISFAGGSGSREDVNRNITSQNSGCLYIAALIKITSTETDYFFHLNVSSFYGRVYTANTGGNLNFGISKTGTTAAACIANTNFSFNTTYLMVMKYEFINGSSNDRVSLWILSEPKSSETDAGTALSIDSAGTDAASLTQIAIRQGTKSAVGSMDEIRMANTWEEAVGTSVWNGSSWSLGTPDSITNIKITDHLSLGTHLNCHHIHIAAGKTIQLGSKQLGIFGTINGTGTISGSSESDLIVHGNTGTLYLTIGSRTMHNVSLTENASLTLGTIMQLCSGTNRGTLTLGNNSVLNANGFLILKSDSIGTARIASVGSGATIQGEITQERFVPARRAFRFLSAPLSTTTGIDDAWQQNTHITGSGIGFDNSSSNSPSMFYLNESNQQWTAIQNTQTQNLTQGMGYRLMIRGNRNIDLNNSTALPNSCTLSATGTHTPGNQVFNDSSTPALCNTLNGYTLLGNPFPSAIDWNLISRSNISSTYYVWRSQGGSNGKGAYVNYNASGQVSSDGNVNSIIGSGSAFVVQTTGSNPVLSMEEADKTSDEQGNSILGKNKKNELRISVFENDTQFVDGLLIYQNPSATSERDEFDSEKWINPGFNFYSMGSHSEKYSIQGIPSFQELTQMNLGMEKADEQKYSLHFEGAQNMSTSVFLVDAYAVKAISLKEVSVYPFEVNKDLQSKSLSRFYLQFGTTNALPDENGHPIFSLFPNPSHGYLQIVLPADIASASCEVLSLLGTSVLNRNWQQGEILSTTDLTAGVYLLSMCSGSRIFRKYFVHIPGSNQDQK